MPRRASSPRQADLFARPQRSADTPSAPPPDASSDDGSYEPTNADEQARLEMEHGQTVRYIPSKSSAQRRAEQRKIRDLIDRTKRVLGILPPKPQGEIFDDGEGGLDK